MILDYLLIGLMWLLGLFCVALLVIVVLMLCGVIDVNGPYCPLPKHVILMPIGKVMVSECV